MSLRDCNRAGRAPKRTAIVIANPAVSTSTGWPVGFWWSELTHPYYRFVEAGYEVEIFSPEGGACQPDAMSDPRDPSGYSKTDLISMGFIATPELAALPANTGKVREIDVSRFDAIVVAGGQSPMFTFETATEDFADNAVWSLGFLPRGHHIMPWRIEDEMRRIGANYIQAGLWRGFAYRDGNLVTGQQNFSGTETAELVIRALGG